MDYIEKTRIKILEIIKEELESKNVDFKSEEYKLDIDFCKESGYTDSEINKSRFDFVKDVLSMANASHERASYIIMGFNDSNKEMVNKPNYIGDEANIGSLINTEFINDKIEMRYDRFQDDHGNWLSYIKFYPNNNIYYYTKEKDISLKSTKYKKINAEDVYSRNGSSNFLLNLKEIGELILKKNKEVKVKSDENYKIYTFMQFLKTKPNKEEAYEKLNASLSTVDEQSKNFYKLHFLIALYNEKIDLDIYEKLENLILSESDINNKASFFETILFSIKNDEFNSKLTKLLKKLKTTISDKYLILSMETKLLLSKGKNEEALTKLRTASQQKQFTNKSDEILYLVSKIIKNKNNKDYFRIRNYIDIEPDFEVAFESKELDLLHISFHTYSQLIEKENDSISLNNLGALIQHEFGLNNVAYSLYKRSADIDNNSHALSNIADIILKGGAFDLMKEYTDKAFEKNNARDLSDSLFYKRNEIIELKEAENLRFEQIKKDLTKINEHVNKYIRLKYISTEEHNGSYKYINEINLYERYILKINRIGNSFNGTIEYINKNTPETMNLSIVKSSYSKKIKGYIENEKFTIFSDNISDNYENKFTIKDFRTNH